MRWLILLASLLLALVFYFVGSATGTVFFLVVGLAFELAFWIGLLKPRGDSDVSKLS